MKNAKVESGKKDNDNSSVTGTGNVTKQEICAAKFSLLMYSMQHLDLRVNRFNNKGDSNNPNDV